jgi:hypothetical protein
MSKVHNFRTPCGAISKTWLAVAAEKKNITCKKCLAKMRGKK